MFKIRDSKQLPQFIKNIQNFSNENDDFMQNNIDDSLALFESLQEYEKNIDKILAKKRMEIQENFTYCPEQLTSCLRVYFQTQVVTNESGLKSIELAIFGKLLQNKHSSNSLFRVEEEIKGVCEFKTHNFLDMVTAIRIDIPSISPIEYSMSDYKKVSLKSEPIERHGFFVVRELTEEISLPLTISVELDLDNYNRKYKLTKKAGEFMNKTIASRSEVLGALKNYMDEHDLLKENIVTINPLLRDIFEILDKSQECLFLHEVSPLTRMLFEHEIRNKFNIEVTKEEKATIAYDILIDMEIDEVNECMVFFVQKLLFDEKERDKISDEYNVLISSNEKLKQLEKMLLKGFDDLYQQMLKRKNYIDFSNDIVGFLKNFTETQNNLIKTIRSNTNSVLQKRNWNDENDFVENLLRNYEDVLETEIKNYFNENMLVEAKHNKQN